MEKLTKEQRADVLAAFEKKYGCDGDPNIDLVCMRYTVYDGDFIEVKAKDIFAADQFPHIFNGCNVFVEEAPKLYAPVE